MNRDEHDHATPLIELGTVSGDTRGGIGLHWESGGMRQTPGLTDD